MPCIEARDERNARILAAVTAGLEADFARRFRLEHDACPLEHGTIGAGDPARDADA